MKVFAIILAIVSLVVTGVGIGKRIGPQPVLSDSVRVELERVVDTLRVADTVRSQVTKVRTLRDTLAITDTVQVKEFVYRVDTLVRACEACARTVDSLKTRIAVLSALTCTPNDQPVGLWGGYGATRLAGNEVRTGFQVGVGVRLLPWGF